MAEEKRFLPDDTIQIYTENVKFTYSTWINLLQRHKLIVINMKKPLFPA